MEQNRIYQESVESSTSYYSDESISQSEQKHNKCLMNSYIIFNLMQSNIDWNNQELNPKVDMFIQKIGQKVSAFKCQNKNLYRNLRKKRMTQQRQENNLQKKVKLEPEQTSNTQNSNASLHEIHKHQPEKSELEKSDKIISQEQLKQSEYQAYLILNQQSNKGKEEQSQQQKKEDQKEQDQLKKEPESSPVVSTQFDSKLQQNEDSHLIDPQLINTQYKNQLQIDQEKFPQDQLLPQEMGLGYYFPPTQTQLQNLVKNLSYFYPLFIAQPRVFENLMFPQMQITDQFAQQKLQDSQMQMQQRQLLTSAIQQNLQTVQQENQLLQFVQQKPMMQMQNNPKMTQLQIENLVQNNFLQTLSSNLNPQYVPASGNRPNDTNGSQINGMIDFLQRQSLIDQEKSMQTNKSNNQYHHTEQQNSQQKFSGQIICINDGQDLDNENMMQQSSLEKSVQFQSAEKELKETDNQLEVDDIQKKKKKENKQMKKDDTKNLLRNYGQAQNKFILNSIYAQRIIEKFFGKDQIDKIKAFKAWVQAIKLENFEQFKNIWYVVKGEQDEQFKELYRELCFEFYERHASVYVLSSQMKTEVTRRTHIKYISRFLEGIIDPSQFYYFKK